MLTAEERRAWLELAGCALDSARLHQLLQLAADPRDLLEAEDRDLASRFGLSSLECGRLRRRPSAKELNQQLDLMERHGIALLPVSHPAYPRPLFQMRVPPPVVFVKGELVEGDALGLGIVGPRDPTPYALEVTRALVRDLAPYFTIVSGAAMGVDSAAHEAALSHGGRTIAVLGCGIDQNYPARNEGLRRRIGEGRQGALLSHFPPGTRPMRGNFPQRNFVLAGLCQVVVIVEASERSGALVTARAAAEEGRPVFAIPGDITRPNSMGSNRLIRDGASLCTGAEDILAELEGLLRGELETLRQRRQQVEAQPAGGDGGPKAGPGLAPEEATLLRAIQHHPTSHDDLINAFVPHRMDLGTFSQALLMLELNGHIQQQPGRIYAPRL